ncbi:MAG: pgl [Verrucomicrobiales bacterium]|nr:pgl [Verrucomicrobiales bacterium]
MAQASSHRQIGITTHRRLKTRITKIYATDTEVAQAAASEWLDLLLANKSMTVALSGGRIAKTFFQQVVAQSKFRSAEFANVDFFWADERCVPPTDPESNFYLANEHLLQPLKIGQQKIHRLKGELDPIVAVNQANEEISRTVSSKSNSVPVLDLVILGMGEDGHVASMFPNTSEAIAQTAAPYVHVADSPKPPPNRLSLSYATIAAAKQVWVLACGSGKQDALQQSISPSGTTPLARVLKSRSSIQIFTDINAPFLTHPSS